MEAFYNGGVLVKKEFAVIGLGRFGGSICQTLSDQGMEVLAIDMDEDKVNQYANIASHAVVGDTTDEMVLKSLGIRNFDHVIVAIGDNIQASILTTIILKELGVKKITVKAQNDYHEKVLSKIGADKIVHPERDMGKRIANNIISNSVLDYLELSDEHSIIEVIANSRMAGYSLIELDIRAKYGINIVAIKREKEIIVSPQASELIQEGDILIIIGADADIDRFQTKLYSR
ncbi:potassium channel family protein [Priestia koreensis]|uniref:potassium channel family protein n=1 Tax=Priestia koreensis TaxID=284581 RepID=UPI002412A2B6|nr:TrkA family potassium uptake protein [Priestia koreensis]